MTYDQKRKLIILFGMVPGAPTSQPGETWAWDGNEWFQLADTGPAGTGVLSRGLVYDPVRDKIVLFGEGTWEWDGSNWIQVASEKLGPQGYMSGAWDSKRQRVVAVSGLNQSFCLTWEWDGSNWVQVADQGPPWRLGYVVAYDDERQKLVFFGGGTRVGTTTNYTWNFPPDTWAWDGSKWEQVSDFGPPPRNAHQMVNDPVRSKIVLFGGSVFLDMSDTSKGTKRFADTWEWDGTHWSQLQDMGASARTAPSMAYDTARKCAVLFGGYGEFSALGDTWELVEYS